MRAISGALLLTAVFLLVGCQNNTEKKLELPLVPIAEIVAINVESHMGDITIRQGGSEIKIKASYQVQADDRERRKILEDSVLLTTDTGDPSLLTVFSRVADSVTLREGEQVLINLDIEVPAAVKSLVVQSGTGSVFIEKMTCAVSVVNNSGNVTVKDSVFTGKSKISNVIGDVSVTLKSIENAQEIAIAVDVGDVSLNVPKRASYTVTVEELSNRGDTWTNKDGKTKLALSTKVGKVSFQK